MMTLRHRRSLAGIPVLLLAPLLAAPKGCHFGDGDVPIGDNEAGAGGTDGGSTSVGGSSTKGGATGVGGSTSAGGSSTQGGFAGATSVGGSSTFGGSTSVGGSSTGGAGPDAGPCLETLLPFDWENTHGLEVTREDVDALLAGDHRADLGRITADINHVTLSLVGTDVVYVESVPNPHFPSLVDVTCENHLRATALGRFSSGAGLLDETLPGMVFEIAIPTLDGPGPAGDRIVAEGVATIDIQRIRGTVAATTCLRSLQFNMTISRNEFAGTIYETLANSPCDTNDPNGTAIGGEWGVFACGGAVACRTAPNPTIVVEASSCDGIGEQVTASGDEAMFTRVGDALSREEFWGCGCPERSKFVMAWSPSSPLGLKLCRDESADSCEAGCEAPLSYDLSTAFGTAGTNKFRFVD